MSETQVSETQVSETQPLRSWGDDIDPKTIPDSVLMSERGRRNNLKRKTRPRGYSPGRPRTKDRCPCGEMSRRRAAKRNHVCKAPR